MKNNAAGSTARPRRLLFWLIPLLLGLLFFLLNLVADTWLESPGGRQLLQRELGKGLGLPVTLQGDYGLQFLPRLAIEGAGLEVGRQESNGIFIYSGNFSAAVELFPIIHRELRIASISLHDGFIDLANLPAAESAAPGTVHGSAGVPAKLPDVASLHVSNFSIRYAAASDRVDLVEFQLTGFRPAAPAGLEVKARVLRNGSIRAALNLNGSLTVEPIELSTELSIAEMQIALDDGLIDGLSGHWRWDQPANNVSGHLDWQDADRSASLQLELVLDEPQSGALHGSYRSPDLAAPLTLEFVFSLLPDSVALDGVRIDLDDQEIGGSGCFRFTDKAGLHLDLMAGDLDLDKLEPLLPAGHDGEGDLAFVHAFRLRIQRARMEGAVADEVAVEIGEHPECTTAAGIIP